MLTPEQLSKINFEKYQDRLVPVVVQNIHTGKILMMAFANAEAVERSIETGLAHFYSRSRQKLWKKGETSGNTLSVAGVQLDCDGDALAYLVRPEGPACHTGAESCFFTGSEVTTDAEFLHYLEQLIAQRKRSMPEDSYISTLFAEGIDRIAQKVGEEAVETVIAAKNNNADEFRNEAADLLFHLLVMLRSREVELREIIEILRQRHSEG